MKIKPTFLPAMLALLTFSTFNSQLSIAFAQGTAFTYQGQLQNNGSPASGTYNLTFSLFSTNTSGVAVAGPVTNNAVSITNGLFTVLIDFGPDAFTGETNWLQIGVESNGVATFTSLAPRQELTPTPNAIYAESADTLSGTLPASQLTSIGNTNGGSDNFFVGGSGNATTSGFDNTANGTLALSANTSGSDNVANGVLALYLNTSGSYNTADGMDALVYNGSGSENTAIGFAALNSNGSGSNNVATGFEALFFNTSGSYNVANGPQALLANTNDNELVAIGYEALQNDNAFGNGNTSDGNGHNTAIGYQALQLNTSGAGNTAIGYQALIQNKNGNFNTANGDKALYYNTSGSQNTAIGLDALYSNTSGFNNVANGATALFSNTNGVNNTANGYEALYYNTSGSGNTANGVVALYNNTSGSYNVAEGYGALEFNTNDNALVAIGYQALQNYTFHNQGTSSGNGENTAVGYEALQLTTTGAGNTAIGYQALNQNTFGGGNTVNGDYALASNPSSFQSTAIGYEALAFNTNGNDNIAIGYLAGDILVNGNNNIYIGNQGNTTESGVIRIGVSGIQTATYLAGNVSIGGVTPGQELSINGGMDVDAAASDNGTVNTAWTLLFGGASAGEGIGSVRVGGYGDSYGLNFYTDYNKRMTILQNGHVGIGTTNATQLLVVGSGGAYCNGTSWVNGSDRNSKEDFAAISSREVLEKVSALPITEWQYKVDASGLKHIGPMAQDFHAAFGLNGTDDKHIATVDEEGVALAAIQGLNQKVDEKEARIQEQESRIQNQAAEIAELKQNVAELKNLMQSLAAQK